MSSASNSRGPSHQSCNTDHSYHETFYGNYTNYGYHLSEGTMNFNNCQFSLSNPVGVLGTDSLSISSISSETNQNSRITEPLSTLPHILTGALGTSLPTTLMNVP